MTYRLPIMRQQELHKMGFPMAYLNRAYRANQGIAWKINPEKPNSPIVFDTEKFEKWRKANPR
jgi:hypothetical protein